LTGIRADHPVVRQQPSQPRFAMARSARTRAAPIRTPASFCGIVGLKATYGLVSIRGIIPLTQSLDHCGPMTRTVRDAALMLNALARYDKLDIASVPHPAENYVAALDRPVSSFRIGIPRAPFFDLLDTDVARATEEAITLVAKLTRSVRDVALPSTRDVRLAGESYAFHEELYARHARNYMIPTRNQLRNGANIKASDYIRGRWNLELLRRTIDDAFRDFDLVVLPTRRRAPRTVDASIKREESDKPRNPELENTGQFNIYGIPAISIPCGFTSAGLPLGLMIAGPRFSEGKVLALANAYERVTEWHSSRPPLRPDTQVPALKATEESE
jgi:aspartyl-tRNA(Asn)/glutamyl-tRNA(Gln) amidotransferase subunit A